MTVSPSRRCAWCGWPVTIPPGVAKAPAGTRAFVMRLVDGVAVRLCVVWHDVTGRMSGGCARVLTTEERIGRSAR